MDLHPSPRLSADEVRYIATLCRIGLREVEVELFREQLSHILEQFQVLREVETKDVLPTGHSVPLQSVMREDEVAPSYSVEDVLANAPRREGDQFRVRAVLE